MSILSNIIFDKGYQDAKGGRAFNPTQSSPELAKALYSAGWELARCQKGIGKLPLLIHTGKRFYWIVAIEPQGLVFQSTQPDERPNNQSGCFDLAWLFRMKGED